jgi:hypothetical protein
MSDRSLIYCDYNGVPTIYRKGIGGIAWSYRDGKWRAVEGPEVFVNSTVMSKAAFDEMFGELPPLPGRG